MSTALCKNVPLLATKNSKALFLWNPLDSLLMGCMLFVINTTSSSSSSSIISSIMLSISMDSRFGFVEKSVPVGPPVPVLHHPHWGKVSSVVNSTAPLDIYVVLDGSGSVRENDWNVPWPAKKPKKNLSYGHVRPGILRISEDEPMEKRQFFSDFFGKVPGVRDDGSMNCGKLIFCGCVQWDRYSSIDET